MLTELSSFMTELRVTCGRPLLSKALTCGKSSVSEGAGGTYTGFPSSTISKIFAASRSGENGFGKR